MAAWPEVPDSGDDGAATTTPALDVIRPRSARVQPPAATIIFDGDDTLWVTQWLYDQAEVETRLIVEAAGLDGDRWLQLCRERDIANIAKFGFNSGRFPTSVVGAYTQLCEESAVPVQIGTLHQLMRAASSMFQRRAPLVAGAAEVLRALRPDHQLVLLTKGDPVVQRKRLRDSGLAAYFDAVVIVPEKSEAIFRAVLAEVGGVAARSWSVGNSLPSDVAPAIRIGMRGVWIEAHVWDYEKRDPGSAAAAAKQLARLRDLPTFIRGLNAPPTAERGEISG